MRPFFPVLLLAGAAVPLCVGHAQTVAQTAEPFAAADARTAVTKLADDLQRLYLFPEIGARYAAMLRTNLAAGAYDTFASRADFAARVTQDLRAINPDGHLVIREKTAPRVVRSDAGGAPAQVSPILRSGWLAPGIAYVSFRGFTGEGYGAAAVQAFMDAHKDAKTLIIDAREHHGGGAAEMNTLFAYLYPQRTELLTMDQRLVDGVNALGDDSDPTLPPAKGPVGLSRHVHYALPGADTPLRRAKVYLLTSSVTASAGEHLALALKRTHRATLIGTATHGAGHFGQGVDLGGGYRTFIGTGRTFDPDTGKDWEGTGVAPDIAVPADQALDVALKQAGVTITAAQALANLTR